MKINELVGYKNKPEYQVFKNPPTNISNFADAELTAIAKKLDEIGYKQYKLGSGYYAQVYARPQDNYVVKIFRPDEGYQTFLEYIRKNANNPYVPKLKGKIIKLPNGYSLVRIEKLKPIDEDLWSEISLAAERPNDKDLVDKVDKKYPGLVKFIQSLKWIANVDDRLGYDLHPGNMMIRDDGTPVVTDPFS